MLKLKDQGREHLQKREYSDAIDVMYYLYIEIEADDRDPEMFKKLESERITLNGFYYPSGKINRVKTMHRVYEKWWDSIINTLITKGYLKNEKYGLNIKDDDIEFE